MAEPIHITDSEFEKTVLQNPLPVIVDFWAPWCAPCNAIAPLLESLSKEYTGKMVVAKVNVDENPEWAGKYGIRSIPTMLFVYNGKIVHQHVGAAPERIIREAVTQFLQVIEQQKP